MNIITKGIIHPNEQGIQILLISSLKQGHCQELMELFDIDKILELCKNEGEKDRIKDFPISINEIGADRIICLGTDQTEGHELISWIQNRLYLIAYKTDLTKQFQQFLKESVCIITQYDSDDLLFGNMQQLKDILSNFAKSTS